MTYLPTWELTQSLNSQIIIVQPSNHNKKMWEPKKVL